MNRFILRAMELANEQTERMEGLTPEGMNTFMTTRFETGISLKITSLLRAGYLELTDKGQ